MKLVNFEIKSFWFRLLKFFASNQTALVVLLGPFPFMFLSLALISGSKWLWLACALSYIFLMMVAVAPRRYAIITLLDTLLPSIYKVLGLSETDDRITVHHLRSKRKEQYEQLTNYFPSRTGKGRIFSLRKGIVGRCFTSRRVLSESLSQNQNLIEVFPREWGYTPQEVSYLTQDRRSYFAFPIGEEGDFARAVLYMDSARSDKFTSGNETDISEKITSLFLPVLEQILK